MADDDRIRSGADPYAILAELGIAREVIASRGLPPCAEAERLEVVEVAADGREHRLLPEAAVAWRVMQAAARDDRIELHVVSAFRSVERQVGIIRRHLATGRPLDDVLCFCAPPGFSEHHTGRAVDVGTSGSPPLDVGFEHSRAFYWLGVNAARFGFALSYPRGNRFGYAYEPWHWCWTPPTVVEPPVSRPS